MSFKLKKSFDHKVDYQTNGPQVFFRAVKGITGIRPGQTIEIPTGYTVQQLPENHCLQTSHTDHMVAKNVGITSKHSTIPQYGKQIIARVVNYGKSLLNIQKGEPILKGILKAISIVAPILMDPYDPENQYYEGPGGRYKDGKLIQQPENEQKPVQQKTMKNLNFKKKTIRKGRKSPF